MSLLRAGWIPADEWIRAREAQRERELDGREMKVELMARSVLRRGKLARTIEREARILELRAAGLSNPEIAKQIGISLWVEHQLVKRLIAEGRLARRASRWHY